MPDQGLLFALQPITFGLVVSFIVVIVLLVCSALISGSEVAFFSLSPSETNELSKSKSKSAERILNQINKPKDLLATILIANNFVNVAIVIVSTYILEKLVDFDGKQTIRYNMMKEVLLPSHKVIYNFHFIIKLI